METGDQREALRKGMNGNNSNNNNNFKKAAIHRDDASVKVERVNQPSTTSGNKNAQHHATTAHERLGVPRRHLSSTMTASKTTTTPAVKNTTSTNTSTTAAVSTAAQEQPQQPPPPAQPPVLFCDVCWGRPNKQGMTFQQCRTCHVGIHNECYGYPGWYRHNPQFQCYACAAVGTTITVRKRHAPPPPPPTQLLRPPPQHRTTTPTNNNNNRRRIQIQVTERPTECCLCGVDDKTDYYHAMHPVYDHYGSSGRQILLRPDPGDNDDEHDAPRLAWAHTLCCFVIGAHYRTAGCVYGCTRQGKYDGEDDDDNSDTSSVNSDLLVPEPSSDAADQELMDNSIHHFVYCLRLKKSDGENAWTKTIREQQQMKCHICGLDDRKPQSLRIPIQCSAQDTNEFPDFIPCHTKTLSRHESCYVPMHVGCAMWGRNDVGQLPTNRRVYFFPGKDGTDDSTGSKVQRKKKFASKVVANLFCSLHAQDLVEHNITGSSIVRYPQVGVRQHSPNSAGIQTTSGAAAKASGAGRKRPLTLPPETHNHNAKRRI